MRWMIGAFLVGALGVSAQAATLYVDGLVPGKHDDVKIKWNGDAKNVNAGPFLGRIDSSPQFEMYCVDLAHVVSPPSDYEVDVLGVLPLSNGILAGKLFNLYSGGVDNGTKGAALQMAIWDAVYDGGDGFTSGNFIHNGVSSSILTLGASYLSGALSSTDTGSATFFRATSHPNGRNQNMIADIQWGGEPVPEPATMAALAVGISGIARRRKSAK